MERDSPQVWDISAQKANSFYKSAGNVLCFASRKAIFWLGFLWKYYEEWAIERQVVLMHSLPKKHGNALLLLSEHVGRMESLGDVRVRV